MYTKKPHGVNHPANITARHFSATFSANFSPAAKNAGSIIGLNCEESSVKFIVSSNRLFIEVRAMK